MPSVFLCHSSVDKPFVEKLAKDLKRIGVNVWFDKWEIKVGESLTWRIEEGIRGSEYLAVVLSPEAVQSEWVRCELGAAWAKQMRNKKIMVLPVLCRDCDIPLFLADRRYADFRGDYAIGLASLAGALGIQESGTISSENWRRFVGVRSSGWETYRRLEFEQVVTTLVDRAKQFNWSTWVGARSQPFAITLTAYVHEGAKAAVSLKLKGRSYAYMGCLDFVCSPKELRSKDFEVYVGNTVNECEEFVWRKMEDFKRNYGNPTGRPIHSVSRFLSNREQFELAARMVREAISATSWYKGEVSPLATL